MKYAGGLEQEDRQHLWHWVENMGFHVAVQLPLWGEQVGQGSLMGQLSVQCLHLYNIWHLMSVLGHRDRTWSRDLCETVWTSPTRPSYPTLNLGLLVSGLGSSVTVSATESSEPFLLSEHFYISLRRHLLQFLPSSWLHIELSKIACHHDHVLITWNGCKSGGRLVWWTRKSW